MRPTIKNNASRYLAKFARTHMRNNNCFTRVIKCTYTDKRTNFLFRTSVCQMRFRYHAARFLGLTLSCGAFSFQSSFHYLEVHDLTNGGAKEKTCALVHVCAFDNACKTIVIAHVRACEFSKIPRCIVFDSWPHVVHQFPVQVLLIRSPWFKHIARFKAY